MYHSDVRSTERISSVALKMPDAAFFFILITLLFIDSGQQTLMVV